MRPINYLPVAIAALAINSGGLAFAEFSETLEHKLTIALTESYEDDNVSKETGNGYTDSQKIVKEKISNKEVLDFLEEQNVITDEIKGWSIVVRTYEGEEQGFYLVKKGKDDINVSEYLYFNDGSDEVESYTETYAENDTTGTTKGKYALSSWGEFGLYYYDYEESQEILDLYVDGTYTFAVEYRIISNIDDDENTTYVENVTSISIVDTVGEIQNSGEFSSLISGSAKVGSGKAID